MFQGQSQPLKHWNIFTLWHSCLPLKIYCIHQSILARMDYYLFCNYSQTKCFTCLHTSCLWILSLFPGHGLCFLPPILCLAAACHFFFIFCNLAASFHTSSSDLFLGFPTGLLPPRPPSRICYGILLSNICTTCPTHFNPLTHVRYQIIVFT